MVGLRLPFLMVHDKSQRLRSVVEGCLNVGIVLNDIYVDIVAVLANPFELLWLVEL